MHVRSEAACWLPFLAARQRLKTWRFSRFAFYLHARPARAWPVAYAVLATYAPTPPHPYSAPHYWRHDISLRENFESPFVVRRLLEVEAMVGEALGYLPC